MHRLAVCSTVSPIPELKITAPRGLTVRHATGIEVKNSTLTVTSGAPLVLETNAVVTGLSKD
jgi:hypothetical protein